MKVKLLKKIRKRFRILHYPNGIPFGSEGNWMILIDIEDKYGFNTVQKKISDVRYERETYTELMGILIKRVIDYYRKFGTRRLAKKNEIILWHVGKK